MQPRDNAFGVAQEGATLLNGGRPLPLELPLVNNGYLLCVQVLSQK